MTKKIYTIAVSIGVVCILMVDLLLVSGLAPLADSKFSNYIFSSELAQTLTPYVMEFQNLIGKLEGQQVFQMTPITRDEVLTLINQERLNNSVKSLALKSTLNHSAEIKLQDMVDQQYFEHVSPEGKDVSDLATTSGYEFIVIGENLALGPFSNAADLVAAWMASPGHRQNILNASYKDTGIAVDYVFYKGIEQWLAVEHFGTATSVCPVIDASLKSKINTEDAAIKTLGITIDQQKSELNDMNDSDPAKSAKINAYNSFVDQYNEQVKILADDTKIYNSEVRTFNACAATYAVEQHTGE